MQMLKLAVCCLCDELLSYLQTPNQLNGPLLLFILFVSQPNYVNYRQPIMYVGRNCMGRFGYGQK